MKVATMNKGAKSAKGASLNHVNKGVEVKHNETSFDYWSLRYKVNKHETTYR
jgi:hypothetical protein